MNSTYLSLLFGLLVQPFCYLSAADIEFPLTADSKPQEGVPKGSLIKDRYVAGKDSVYPGTERDYQIYLPADFAKDGENPAPYMVFQDGVIYQAPLVFDNLIAQKDIPPLVGIFIRPGVVPAPQENALPRFNRSHEYDSITDTYSRFLIEEFLPSLEKKHRLKLSSDPDHAAIAGNSSGGICAFMTAWHRPDRFRRVFTGVGTYVGIHGADRLPVMVRKMQPKPLRVFLQSGTGDNNLYCGDWWMANQMMERSLTWAGYDVNHAWGEGGHNQKHASQIFPDVLRWLWRDWQTDIEVKANPKMESKWKGYEVVEAGEWLPVSELGPKPIGESSLMPALDGSLAWAAGPNKRTLLRGQTVPVQPVTAPLFEGARTTLSPDQTLLYVRPVQGRYVYSFPVVAHNDIRQGQKFYELETFDHDSPEDRGGLCVDSDGRLYVATVLGIQVCDQAGRVNFIIPTPSEPQDVCFGGKDLRTLFVACKGGVYQRSTKVQGVLSGQQAPVKPTPPKL